MILLGLDLGSAHCGLCAIDTSTTPPTVTGSATVPVGADVAGCVRTILVAVETSGAEVVAVEWNERPYVPKGATPQAAASMAHAREVMVRILDRVEQALDGKVTVKRIAPATWRSRIGVTRRHRAGVAGLREAAWARLNPRRDTTDRRVRRALERALGEAGAGALSDVHQRDAAGTALGVEKPATGAPRVRNRARRGASAERRAAPTGPSKIDLVCEAIRAHGRPIRLDVLAVRMAMDKSALCALLSKAEKCWRVAKTATGVYWLSDDETRRWMLRVA
jgi:hypothetical protein